MTDYSSETSAEPPSRHIPVRTFRPACRVSCRRGWATAALVLSLVAVVVEAVYYPCASLLFDPLPDFISGLAYAWLLIFSPSMRRRFYRPGSRQKTR